MLVLAQRALEKAPSVKEKTNPPSNDAPLNAFAELDAHNLEPVPLLDARLTLVLPLQTVAAALKAAGKE